MKKILLLEPDKQQSELFTSWIREEGYEISCVDTTKEVAPILAVEKFDIILIDIDDPEIIESFLSLCETLKVDIRFTCIPIIVLTHKKDSKKISVAIEAGVDSFIFKPFETDSFLNRLKTVLVHAEFDKQGKKAIDLNYVNYLISEAITKTDIEGFFLLAPAILNSLILDKIKIHLGEPVVTIILERVREGTGENYAFMKHVRFQNDRFYMDGVKGASKDVPANMLIFGFQNFIYEFLQFVKILTSGILMKRYG